MMYKTLLIALLMTTTSCSHDTLKTERAKTPSLFTTTYSKITRTVQRLIKYFHKYVWTSWSKTSLFLLMLCACMTAEGMSNKALFPWYAAKRKKKLPPSLIQSLHGTHVSPTQPTSQAKISTNKYSHRYGAPSTIAPIDSPRSVASEERDISHSHSKVMAQVALGAAAAFASGCALKAVRTRLQSHPPQPTSPTLKSAESSSEEVVYGPLYPTDIALIHSLPKEIQQLLTSFIKGPFKLFHEQHRLTQQEAVMTYDPDYLRAETCFHDTQSLRYDYIHTEEALAFIDDQHIKFLAYREADFPSHFPSYVYHFPFDHIPTTTCCVCTQIYIGPDKPKEGLTSKTVTTCKSYLPLDKERFPTPAYAPEEHRVSIYRKPAHEKYLPPDSRKIEKPHHLYESVSGNVSRFGDGIRRVLPDNEPALWFVPFKTFLAIYEEITSTTKRHHIIDEENYPHPPEIPLIIHDRCHTPHQLIQLIKADHEIEALTVPLALGDTYQKRHQTIRENDFDEDDYGYYDRPRVPPSHRVIPSVPSTSSRINFFAFNFDRNIQGKVKGERKSFSFIGSLELTGEEIKKERYITYPPHTGPNRKKALVFAQPEDIECVIFKRRARDTDDDVSGYDVAELFQQVVPPPPAPEQTRLQKMRNVFMPPQQERLEIRF